MSRLTLDPGITSQLARQQMPNMEDPAEARAATDALITEPRQHKHVELTVTEVNGRELRVFTPRSPIAVMLSFHGGGFIAGSARGDDSYNVKWAATHEFSVVCVDYRLAPENPYPAALEDCAAALDWAAKKFPNLPILLFGESAGGNLAAALALWVRDHQGPEIAACALIEPVLDASLSTESMQAATDTAVWDLANATASWRHYLGGKEPDMYASPSLAEDLRGLPPTLVVANQADPLLDEDLEYARRLALADVPVEALLVPQACHGLLSFDAAVARRTRARVDDFLGRYSEER